MAGKKGMHDKKKTPQSDLKVEMKPNASLDAGFVSTEAVEDIYDRFEQHRIEHTTDGPVPEVISEELPTVVAEEAPKEEFTEPEPKIQEEPVIPTAKEEYVKEETKEPQKEEKLEKTVPLAALHESRNENKELRRRLQALEAQVNSNGQPPAEEDPSAYEYVTKSDLRTIQEKLDTIAKKEKEIALNAERDEADRLLSLEGIKGYKDLYEPIVLRELQRMYQVDPELCFAHDNVQGWVKIVKEKYPTVKNYFVQNDMNKVLTEKIERKQTASMVGSPGIKDVKPGEEKKPALSREEAHAEYLRERRATLL